MYQNIAVTEALDLVLANANSLAAAPIPLADAQNRVLATSIFTTEAIPPFDNSGVDGFVVRLQDLQPLPAILPISTCIAAGEIPPHTLSDGSCMQIMTGAPLPEGGEAVAMVEWTTRLSETHVQINKAPSFGQHIRRAGSDLTPNTLIFEAGTRLNAPHLGMLATLGCADISVAQQPKVAILTTGNEVVDVYETPKFGQIRNSNGAALAAQVSEAGGELVYQDHARDTKTSVQQHIEAASAADVLLVSGGVSMGEFDFVRVVLDEMQWQPIFWKVRQRPGKPLAFGILQQENRALLVFGLPGNPVSSSVCFEQYVRPALLKMQGATSLFRHSFHAQLASDFTKVKGLHFFARGIAQTNASGQMFVVSTGEQGSHIYSSMTKANCIVHLPEDWEFAHTGTIVECSWL